MRIQKNSFFLFGTAFSGFFRQVLTAWNRFRPPFFNEDSSLKRLFFHYPAAKTWLVQRYGLDPALLAQHNRSTLREISQKFQLPPPQILFSEVQMSERVQFVRFLTPLQAKALLQSQNDCLVLDARDLWERDIANLPCSQVLDENKLHELAVAANRSQPVLIFCHFGVRSMDFAIRLSEWGYSQVAVLQGGIDAWAQTVDPAMNRYEGSWC
jgi:rhodanese-related sulfurtransferase